MDQHTGAVAEMPQYTSHKKVWALKIATVTSIGYDGTTDENPRVRVTFEGTVFAPREFNLRGKPTPEAGWYFITYADGYFSFSPAQAFEEGYTAIKKFAELRDSAESFARAALGLDYDHLDSMAQSTARIVANYALHQPSISVKSKGDVKVIRMGTGRITSNWGTYEGLPAIFLEPADDVTGKIGEQAPGTPTDTVTPGGYVMQFRESNGAMIVCQDIISSIVHSPTHKDSNKIVK